VSTKRHWIVVLQFLVGAALAGVALALPGPKFLQMTLAVFWLMAFASATHDIAADGFYMLACRSAPRPRSWACAAPSTAWR
jgi:PAT family beta-lactamase induction signal transducer AmpG